MKKFLKRYLLVITFVVGLILFFMPLKINEPVEMYSEPTYCTQEMSSSTDSIGKLMDYSGCTVGEEIMLPQPLSQEYSLNYLHLAIRGAGLLLMLVVAIIWFIKSIFWVAHKIAMLIGRERSKEDNIKIK